MEQYINKSALIAEIENRRDEISKRRITIPLTGRDKSYATFFEYEILGKIRDFAKHFFELGLKTMKGGEE